MGLYNSKVMDYFINPRNIGIIENADGIGEVGNTTCGDIIKIYLKIKGDIIEDVKFEAYGCASAIASSSMATELIKGKSICNALTLTKEDIVNELGGLPQNKVKCSVLANEAIKKAIDDYYTKEPEKYIDDNEENINIKCCTHSCCCKQKGCEMCK